MVGINDVYEIVQNVAQKAKHGSITVLQFDKYANLANGDLYNERLGAIRDYYKLGKAISKTGVGMNKQLDQAMKVFLVKNLSVVVTSNLGTLPDDCEYVDSITYNGKSVKWIPTAKIPDYINSTIDFPTTDFPIYSDTASGIEVHPVLTPVLVNYYKTPDTVKWNYTIVANKPVYNATGSVDFQWDSTQKLELVSRILSYIGITIRDGELLNYAKNEQNTIA